MEFLDKTFEPRVTTTIANQNLEYFEINTIKNWLRMYPEETLMISFVEHVEALKLSVEVNQAKVLALDNMQ